MKAQICFQENVEYGIVLWGDDNVVHHNTFVDNNIGGSSQAFDGGTNNVWYDISTLEGNFWSDYDGDGNYTMDGVGTADLYPLLEPVTPPIIHEYSYHNLMYIPVILLFMVGIPLNLRRKRKNK